MLAVGDQVKMLPPAADELEGIGIVTAVHSDGSIVAAFGPVWTVQLEEGEFEKVEDDSLSKYLTGQKRLLAIEQKLSEAGLNLDDLIDLIEARQNGKY